MSALGAIACFAALCASPALTEPRIERVDLVEVNHYFDQDGNHLLDQIIAYEWSPQESRHQVRGWRLMKSASQYPVAMSGGYEVRLGFHERIVSARFRESWTQFDPELIERKHLARELRRELFSEGKP